VPPERQITFCGRTQSLRAWARELGQSPQALHYRLAAGWPLERALSPNSPQPRVREARAWREAALQLLELLPLVGAERLSDSDKQRLAELRRRVNLLEGKHG